MLPKTVIIICAGSGARWNNHLKVSKHFISIDGEPLIHRTVRQVKQYKDIINVVVVANDDKQFDFPGTVYVPELNPDNRDADKFLSSKELWCRYGRTVVLYGDVFFTDHAINRIMNYAGKDWTAFGRPHGSITTGNEWPELFAQSFYPEHIHEHETTLLEIRDLYQSKTITRTGGWEHYSLMAKDGVRFTHRFELIDDFTEDFDYVEDYKKFIERYYRDNNLLFKKPYPTRIEWEKRLSSLIPYINLNNPVLDIGCNRGFLGIILHRKGHRGKYVGVDKYEPYLDSARMNNKHNGHQNAEFILTDFTSDDSVFRETPENSTVILSKVLERLPDDSELLNKIPPGMTTILTARREVRPEYARSFNTIFNVGDYYEKYFTIHDIKYSDEEFILTGTKKGQR